MAGRHAVELGAAIGDGAGQQVEPPGGGFGVGDRLHALGQCEPLHQRDEVDAALFQHRAGGKVDAVHSEFGEPVGDRAPGTGQERGAHAVGHRAEAQIEAGGLHLFGQDRRFGGDLARIDHGGDLLAGKNAGHRWPLCRL